MAINTEINKYLVEEMFAVYTAAEQEMLQKVAKRIKKGITDIGWNELKAAETTQLKNEFKALLDDTTVLSKKKLGKGIVEAYLQGINSANFDVGIPVTAIKGMVPAMVQRWILEANNMIDNTQFQILRNVDDEYRRIIADVATMSMIGVETREQVAQAALNKMAAKGITGFVDKAGRNWELASYVEMAVRTTTARAALQGHVDRQQELGEDLIQVSSILATCPLCSPWQGRVLSISGQSGTYNSLDSAKAAGLFHPNCKHTIMLYSEELDYPQIIDKQSKNNDELYEKTQEQRFNERQIRKWKRMEAVAIVPTEKIKAQQKIYFWQQKQESLINQYAQEGLRRNFKREGIKNRIGKAALAKNDLLLPKFEFKQAPPLPKVTTQKELKAKVSKMPPVVQKVSLSLPKYISDKDLSFYQGGGFLGGAGQKHIYLDTNGEEYLFKPALTKGGNPAPFKADVQEAVSIIHNIVNDGKGLSVQKIELDYTLGTIQPLVGSQKAIQQLQSELSDSYYGAAIPKKYISDLQREHVTDWLVGNFDSHSGNFILDTSGSVLGIDKEQAFRYLTDPGSKKMSLTYHPNAYIGEKEPIYNVLFSQYASGKIDINLQDTYKYIQRVEAISDDVYREAFRSYAEELHGKGNVAETMLDLIVERKKNLKKDYEEFFTFLEEARNGSISKTFEFSTARTRKARTKIKKGDFDESSYIFHNDSFSGINSSKKDIKAHSEYWKNKEDLNDSLYKSVKEYTGGHYTTINNYLRSDKKDYKSHSGTARNIKEALKDTLPLEENTKFLRHTPRQVLEYCFEDSSFGSRVQTLVDKMGGANFGELVDVTDKLNELKANLIGATFRDKGFLSMSHREGVFVSDYGIEYQFFIPKGYKKGTYVEQISNHRSECEYLVQSEEKFQIVDVGIENIAESHNGRKDTKNLIIKLKLKE